MVDMSSDSGMLVPKFSLPTLAPQGQVPSLGEDTVVSFPLPPPTTRVAGTPPPTVEETGEQGSLWAGVPQCED